MKIITLVDKNEDFIELQYKTIQKHIKYNFEYIVFNNGATEQQTKNIKNICNTLNINQIELRYFERGEPSNIVANTLRRLYIDYFKAWNDEIFYIDSDMFLIGDIYKSDFETLSFVPMYRGNHKIFSMWSGIWYIDFSKIKHDIDFGLGYVDGIQTDVMGKTHYVVKENYPHRYWSLYNLYKEENNIIETNYNTTIKINFDKTNYTILDDYYQIDKLQPHMIQDSAFIENLKLKYQTYKNILDSYNFPKPYNVDFIQFGNVDKVIHFKSSNWCPWYYPQYVDKKKTAITNFIIGK